MIVETQSRPLQVSDCADIRLIKHGKANIELSYKDEFVTENILSSIQAGWYEWKEALAARELVSKEDRVLELGAGLGFLSTYVQKHSRPKCYVAAEADQRLITAIQNTHAANKVSGVNLLNCVVTSDKELLSKGFAEFSQAKAFWGSSADKKIGHIGTVQVKTMALRSIIDKFGINVLLADIEGGEWGLLNGADLTGIRAVSVEIHPQITGRNKIKRIFNQLHAQGLIYDHLASWGAVVAFSRETRRSS